MSDSNSKYPILSVPGPSAALTPCLPLDITGLGVRMRRRGHRSFLRPEQPSEVPRTQQPVSAAFSKKLLLSSVPTMRSETVCLTPAWRTSASITFAVSLVTAACRNRFKSYGQHWECHLETATHLTIFLVECCPVPDSYVLALASACVYSLACSAPAVLCGEWLCRPGSCTSQQLGGPLALPTFREESAPMILPP